MFPRHWLVSWMLTGALVACGGRKDEGDDSAPSDTDADTDSDTDTDADTDADTDTDTDADADADTDSDSAPTADTGTSTTDTGPFIDLFDPGGAAETVEGAATWSVDFDKALEAKGSVDCTYSRTYANGVEDRSAPWLCRDCDRVFRVEVTMGKDDLECYRQLTGDPASVPPPVEWVGWSSDGRFFRTSALNVSLAEQGVAVDDGKGGVTFDNAVDNPKAGYGFAVTGAFTTGVDAGADPWHGYLPTTSSCGWHRSGPVNYEGDYTADVGDTLPDGLFEDACGDAVRLHDFSGKYLVVDISAMDCPPCQDMAQEEPQFVADMAAEGIDVEMITLLAPSLSAVLAPTSTAELQEWTDTFGLTSPVLADRGWGFYVIGDAVGPTAFAYPSYAIVSPDLEVIDLGTGFGGFTPIKSVIRAHHGP